MKSPRPVIRNTKQRNCGSDFIRRWEQPKRLLHMVKSTGSKNAPVENEKPEITFNDIGGLSELKKTIHRKIILPFQRPDIYAAYGRSTGGGILLYGPPGCGKTHIARATAGGM